MWVSELSAWRGEGQGGKEDGKRSRAGPSPWASPGPCMPPSPAESSPRGPCGPGRGHGGRERWQAPPPQAAEPVCGAPASEAAFVSCSVSAPLCSLPHRRGLVRGVK